MSETKVPELRPDLTGRLIGPSETPSMAENLRLDPTYTATHPRRDPNEADRLRRVARASTVEHAVAPVPENAMALSYRWGINVELARRLLALEHTQAAGVPQELFERLAALEEKAPVEMEQQVSNFAQRLKNLEQVFAQEHFRLTDKLNRLLARVENIEAK